MKAAEKKFRIHMALDYFVILIGQGYYLNSAKFEIIYFLQNSRSGFRNTS